MVQGRSRWLVVALAVVASSLVVMEVKPALASSSYEAAIEGNQPVKYLRFGESSSATAPVDEMGSSGETAWADPGQIAFGVSPPMSGSNTAISLSSSGSAAGGARFGIGALDAASSASIEVWVKPSGLPPSGVESDIVSLSGCCIGYSVAGLRVGLTSSGTVVAEAGRDQTGDTFGSGDPGPSADASRRTLRVESTHPVNDGAWHQVVAVYDHRTRSVWVAVDGRAVGEGRDDFDGLEWSSIPHVAPHWMSVGLPVKGVTTAYSGAVDELSVYDKALSLADIRSDFLASGLPAPGGWNVPDGITSGTEILGPNAAKDWDELLRCRCADPVDTGSGNLHMPVAPVAVPGRGPGLRVDMAYNSLAAATPSSIGYGWSSTLDMTLVDVPFTSRKHVVQETGATVPFDPDGGGWKAPPGYTATLARDGSDWVFTRNHTEVFRFDTHGRLKALSDQFGLASNTTTVAYPTSDSSDPAFRQASAMTDGAGRSLAIAWSAGRVSSITEPAVSSQPTRSAGFTYDADGNLATYKDVSGGTTVFTWSDSERNATAHLMTKMRRPRHLGDTSNSKVIENNYDATGRVEWQRDELNRRTDFAYGSPSAGKTTVTMPPFNDAGERHIRIDTYVDGIRTETETAAGTAAQQTTGYEFWPGTNAPKTITDNAGETTSFTADVDGNLLSSTDPTGRTTRWTYGVFDQVTSVKSGERNGNTSEVVTTVNEYDPGNGRLEKTTVASGTADAAVTDYVYGVSAHPEDVTKVIDPRNKEWTSGYDGGTGYLEWSENPEHERTAFSYNEIGWPKTVTSPRGTATASPANDFQTSYTYDIVNRSTTTTGPTGDKAKTVLDANGNVASVATGPALADVTAYTYTDADELKDEIAPGGATKSYVYFPNGAQKSFTNERGSVTSYTYDANGNVLTETDPSNRTTSSTYDTVGRLKSVLQPVAGATCTAATKVGCIQYFYDHAGRITGVDYSDPKTADLVGAGSDYTAGVMYDGLGRRTSARSQDDAGSWTETWAWTKRSQPASHTDRNGDTTSYQYNADGTQRTITYPGSKTVTRGFDDAGRLTSTTDWASRTATFSYDEDSNWDRTTFGTANTDVYGHDQAGRMISSTWHQGAATGPSLGSETYTRPTATKGMVDTMAPAGAAGTAARDNAYDSRDRLTSTGTGGESFTLDDASNLLKGPGGKAQAYDTAQQLCWSSATGTGSASTSMTCPTAPSDATTFAYDELGNRTAAQPVTGAKSTYAYDQANRLTTADTHAADTGEGQFVTFGVARLLDTRSPTGGACDLSPCSRLTASVTKTATIAGRSPVPATDVAAVWATVTVINPSADGYLRINETGGAGAVTLNYRSGVNRNSTAIIPLVDGKVTLHASTAVDVVLDVTGYFKTAGTPADTYKPIAPYRVADTRTAIGTCNASPCTPTTGTNATVLVDAAGSGGLPSTGMHAAVISLTVINPASNGQIKVSPIPFGGGAATINYTAGETMNETVVAPVDSAGKLTITTSTGVDFVVIASGYFTAPAAGALGQGYHNVTPQRLVTVTSGTGAGPCVGAACGPLVDSQRQRIQIAGNAGVPATAAAVVGYLTLTNPAADGYLRLNPDFSSGMGFNGDQTVNVNGGEVRNSLVMIPLKADGTIEIVSGVGVTTWSLDISGYLSDLAGATTYAYGADGIRTKKMSPQGAATTFTYSDHGGLPLLLRQRDTTGDTYLVYGPGGQPIEQINPDGTALWLHHDQLGSVRLATIATDGSEHSRRRFNAYGTPATEAVTIPSARQPLLGYAGQYTDTESGYQYLRARYYDPTTGQFLTKDPLLDQTRESYGYAGENPSWSSDPFGLCARKASQDSGEKSCAEIYEQILNYLYGKSYTQSPSKGPERGLIERWVRGIVYNDGDPGHQGAFYDEKAGLNRRLAELRRAFDKDKCDDDDLPPGWEEQVRIAETFDNIRFPSVSLSQALERAFDGSVMIGPLPYAPVLS